MFSKKKIRSSVATKAALVALAACVASPAAMAAFVCATPNIAIPNDISGVYLNLITGATGTSGAAVPGYDVNPYNNNAGLTFFLPADGTGLVGSPTPNPPAGGIANPVPTGTVIGPASTYSGAGQVSGTNFQTAGTRYVGIRFRNEGTTLINYGWVEIVSGATAGFPATISRHCYENTGATINAGSLPVTLQNFSVD